MARSTKLCNLMSFQFGLDISPLALDTGLLAENYWAPITEDEKNPFFFSAVTYVPLE